jgi:hypothetical protein
LKTVEGLLTHRSFWEDLIGRLGGPITFRLILQPSIAVILAIRDGLKDAKAGRFISGASSPIQLKDGNC